MKTEETRCSIVNRKWWRQKSLIRENCSEKIAPAGTRRGKASLIGNALLNW